MIIGVNGYAGSGKDTIGRMIQFLNCKDPQGKVFEDIMNNPLENEWWLEEQSCWEIKKWAGKLKTIASLLTGIPVEKFEDQEFKNTNLPSEWDSWGYRPINKGDNLFPHFTGEPYRKSMTVREFLQKLGTDGLRDGLHENTWVNALMADYKVHEEHFNDIANGRDTDNGYPNWIITDTRFPNEAQAIKDMGGIIIRIDRPGVNAVNAHPSETSLDDWKFDYKLWNGSDMISLMFSVYNVLKKEKLLNEDNKAKNKDFINER